MNQKAHFVGKNIRIRNKLSVGILGKLDINTHPSWLVKVQLLQTT